MPEKITGSWLIAEPIKRDRRKMGRRYAWARNYAYMNGTQITNNF